MDLVSLLAPPKKVKISFNAKKEEAKMHDNCGRDRLKGVLHSRMFDETEKP